MTTPMREEDVNPQVALQALLAKDLTAFTEFNFGVVRPGVPLKRNWHLDAVTYKLYQLAKGHIRRLIITLPPRSLKSLCASVGLPAWFLGHYPWERVVVVSYSDFLSRTHANDFRRVINHPLYRATFPAMRLDRDTDREITTTERGKRITTSIDGTLTGLGTIPSSLATPCRMRCVSASSNGIARPCFRAAMISQRRGSLWSCKGCIKTIWSVTLRSKAALKS